MKYCNKCGFKLGVDAKFCSKCGNKIELNDYDTDITSISKSLNLTATISEDERKKQESAEHKDSKYIGLDRKSNYERLMLDPVEKSNSSTLSTIRYLVGIFLLIIGIIQSSIMIFLAGISLFPIVYEFVDSHLKMKNYGKMILKAIAVILPVLLLVTIIPDRKPAEVQIMNSKNSISIGEVHQMSAKTNISGYDVSDFIWKSSNTKVATISNGYLTGVSEGTTVISVEIYNGVKAEFTLDVKYIPMTSLKITGDDTFFTGTQKKMSVSISPSNATNKKLTWSSSNPNVATVDQTGNVNTVSKGNTVIKVESIDGVVSEHSISVFQSVESLSLSKSDFSLKVGASTSLTYTISPKSASDSPIEWRSSNQSVATVVNGKVTGVAPGKSTITLTVGNKTISTSVMVQKKSPISIVNFSYTKNTVGGVEWTFRLRNNTDKTINYITLVWYNFNAVGDPVYDEITDKNYHGVKFTGPLNAGATTTSRRTTNLFYSFSYKSSLISDVKIEYADGTIETIKNEDLGLYYDFSVPK